MKLSVVATLYQSAAYIAAFHQRASAVARQLAGDEYEIVLVNDGSPDISLDIAVQLTENDSHLVVIDLSRNFGHHKAMMTGLAHAQGQRIFLIDSDLEEEPEWLIGFADTMASKNCDVVYGVQAQRKGGFFERWSGRVFYRLFNALANIKLPENLVAARLMSRRYVDALLLHQERELMISGLWQITGFKQVPVAVKKHNTSDTTYTLSKKIKIAVDSVTSFSSKPLYFVFYTGVGVSVSACLYISYLIYRYVFWSAPPNGWMSVIASIWLLGGINILFIGVIAIYLSKMFVEVKQRPYTIVRDIFKKSAITDMASNS